MLSVSRHAGPPAEVGLTSPLTAHQLALLPHPLARLVKNSWSDHWGDGGYIKIAVDDGACGVTTDTIYAVVDEAALRASAAA